ncbi:MAG: ClpX C4-type zinc finger protein [Serratia sp. (in: enterobacteria)]
MPHDLHRPYPEEHHTDDAKKLAGITSRLQNIMLTENITANELVGCARIVRKNHEHYENMSKNSQEHPTAASDKYEGKEYFCSFCGKSSFSTRKFITGPDVCICNERVDVCEDILTGLKAT